MRGEVRISISTDTTYNMKGVGNVHIFLFQVYYGVMFMASTKNAATTNSQNVEGEEGGGEGAHLSGPRFHSTPQMQP